MRTMETHLTVYWSLNIRANNGKDHGRKTGQAREGVKLSSRFQREISPTPQRLRGGRKK